MAKAIFERSEKPLYRVYDGERLVLKRCSKCHQHKSPGEFGESSASCDGRNGQCRECRNGNARDERKARTGFCYRCDTPVPVGTAYCDTHRADQRERSRAFKDRMRMRTDEELLHDMLRAHPDGMKLCVGECRTIRPLSEFGMKRHEHDGKQGMCRPCDTARKHGINLSELLAYWEELDLWRCDYCGGPFEDIEHVIPRAQGGTDDISNLRPSCANCNRGPGGKFAMTPAQWRPDEEAALWAVVCNR